MCAIFVSLHVNVSVYELCLCVCVGILVFNSVFRVSVYESVRVCASICMYACVFCACVRFCM